MMNIEDFAMIMINFWEEVLLKAKQELEMEQCNHRVRYFEYSLEQLVEF